MKIVQAGFVWILLKITNSATISMFLQGFITGKYGSLCIRLDSDKNSGWWLPV